MNKRFYMRFLVFALWIQNSNCIEVAVPETLPELKVPASGEEYLVIAKTLRSCKSSIGKQFFPVIRQEESSEVTPGTDVYGGTHLRYLFSLDGLWRSLDKFPEFSPEDGLFQPMMRNLNHFLGVDNIEFQYLPCALQGGGSCWLHSFINLARFFNPELLPLGRIQFKELVEFLFKPFDPGQEVYDLRPSELLEIMATRSIAAGDHKRQGFKSAAPALATLFKFQQMKPGSLAYDKLSSAVLDYVNAIKTVISQSVQMPQVRQYNLYMETKPPVLFMGDFRALNPNTGTLEQHATILRTSLLQALSKEALLKFRNGQAPLIICANLTNYAWPLSRKIKEADPRKLLEVQRSLAEGYHAIAAQVQVVHIGVKKILQLKIMDSSTEDPLLRPSLIAGLFMLIANLANQAGLRGKNLWPEVKLKEYASELIVQTLLDPKSYGATPIAEEKLFKKYDEIFSSHAFNLLQDRGDLSNPFLKGAAFSIAELKLMYRKFLQALKEFWRKSPRDSRLLHVEAYFKSDRAKEFIGSIDPQIIINIFLLGIGLSKEDWDFIDVVYAWRDDISQASSFQLEFCARKAVFDFDTNLKHGLDWGTLNKQDGRGRPHLEVCHECLQEHKKSIEERFDMLDKKRFDKWFNPKKPSADPGLVEKARLPWQTGGPSLVPQESIARALPVTRRRLPWQTDDVDSPLVSAPAPSQPAVRPVKATRAKLPWEPEDFNSPEGESTLRTPAVQPLAAKLPWQ